MHICIHLKRQHSYSKMDDDRKYTPEVNALSEASIRSINASLPWKWSTVHDSRESQLRQVILIFIDNMITGVLLIISPLQVSHQLSLIILNDKQGALVTLWIQPRVIYNACWLANHSFYCQDASPESLFMKQTRGHSAPTWYPLSFVLYAKCRWCNQCRHKFWQCSPNETVPSGWRWNGKEARQDSEGPWEIRIGSKSSDYLGSDYSGSYN